MRKMTVNCGNMKKERFKFTVQVLVNMPSSKMWGLHPDKGWCRPLVVEHNGEWYIKENSQHEQYFDERYYDFTKDIQSGIYQPTGIKVGEE